MRSSPTISGTFVVALLIAGSASVSCGGGDPTEPAARSPAAASPATLEATSPTSLSAQVATAVTVAVSVRDAGGAPVQGVQVSFPVTLGGGSITPAAAVTDAAGLASGSWRLGTATGANESRAAVIGLQPVVFTAMATAGPASVVEKVDGDAQEGQAGMALAKHLSVRVQDAHGNAITAATVTFSVTSGGGAIHGSPASTTSDGLASAGPWTLGTAITEQTVSASVGSAAVVFTARVDPCPRMPIAIGVPVAGSLAPGDCAIAGGLADRYQLTLSTAQAVTISLESMVFIPRLMVADGSGALVASGDQVGTAGTTYCVFDDPPLDGCHTASTSTPGSPISLLAAAGSQVITASSAGNPGTGAYALAVQGSANSVSACRTMFIERGVTTEQQLDAADCRVQFGDAVVNYSDDIKIHLTAGAQLQVSMSSSAFTPWLDFFSPTGRYLGGCVSPGTATCTFTIAESGYYLLAASSLETARAGAYTLTVR